MYILGEREIEKGKGDNRERGKRKECKERKGKVECGICLIINKKLYICFVERILIKSVGENKVT